MNFTAFLPARLRIFVYITLLLVAIVIFLMPAVTPWTGAEWTWGSWGVEFDEGKSVVLVAGRAEVRELTLTPEEKRAKARPPREMGRRTGWHLESGFVIEEVHEIYPARRFTWYTPEGRVLSQFWEDETGLSRTADAAPWWWDVKDQTKPTAPWLESGMSPLEWIAAQKDR